MVGLCERRSNEDMLNARLSSTGRSQSSIARSVGAFLKIMSCQNIENRAYHVAQGNARTQVWLRCDRSVPAR